MSASRDELDRALSAAYAEIDTLRAENEALACNLRGKHALAGATYAHLVQERDTLRKKLAEQDALLESAAEGASILRSLIENIEAKGNYSPESTASFLQQALHCFSPALSPSASAEPSAPAERGPWLPLSAPGQIQEGDWLCFTVSGSFICAQARLIIYPGTDKEEIVYNRKKNHYFCTDMAIAGTSNHKGVLVAKAKP
ncbi:hypothetical protein V1687_18335 [Pseudomonas putida]|uniref:hypothetical protein n=1 Tax=Pseudomonas putida TaxID=303 RepID=UPI002ED2926C|nr:hypothetical protein V1687_18335 [Pseudomonas putida]